MFDILSDPSFLTAILTVELNYILGNMQTLPILGLFMSVVGSVASDYGNSSTGDLEDELLPNETTYECLGPSREDMELYGKLAWWMDGVIQVSNSGYDFLRSS